MTTRSSESLIFLAFSTVGDHAQPCLNRFDSRWRYQSRCEFFNVWLLELDSPVRAKAFASSLLLEESTRVVFEATMERVTIGFKIQ